MWVLKLYYSIYYSIIATVTSVTLHPKKKKTHKKLLEIISGKGYADSSLYVYFLKETKRHNRCVDSMKNEQNFHNIISSSSPANSSDPFIGTV